MLAVPKSNVPFKVFWHIQKNCAISMRFLIFIRKIRFIEARHLILIVNLNFLRRKHYEQHRHDKRKSRNC
jgi:hypothetical protein